MDTSNGYNWYPYSIRTSCLTGSAGVSGTTSTEAGASSSIGVIWGVGSICVVTTNGALWGRGEISIESLPGPGEEDGMGGVTALSAYD